MNSFAHIKTLSALGLVFVFSLAALSQEPQRSAVTASGIHIGERLTYNISFQRYDSVGYAEIFAVSQGKLGDADAVELRMKLKTTGILFSAFYQIDESRTTFANPDTGAPLLVRRQDNSGVTTRETVSNYLTSPAQGLDFLTFIYKARQSGGAGSFILVEGDKTYSLTLLPQGAEHLRTDAGEFDTTISIAQSEFLAEHQIQSLRINFSTDETHIPVMLRFKNAKGEFKIVLSGVQNIEPETEPTPTPSPAATPKPVSTPKPTPTPYIDDQPLSADVGFTLGEKLTYRLSNGDKPVATFFTEAKQRKFISGEDSLVLVAAVDSGEQGNGLFTPGDSVTARVDPETLVPFETSAKMTGPLAVLNQSAKFDRRTGAIVFGANRTDAPIGTHTILSLLYAVRSFNLTPSKDIRNPVNDTRVAVFWQDKAYIFMLRPFEPETVTVNGQKIFAQKISVKTNVPQLDQLGITLWLTEDTLRLPVLIKIGSYQAELIARAQAR